MDAFTKDLIQVLAWLVAAIGGTIAAFKAVTELHRANVERAKALIEKQRELRWRKLEMARTMLDQLWADPLARAAMKMLDWSGLEYKRDDKKTKPITHKIMEDALRTTNIIFNEDELFVRDSFDQLFDGLERIEHYLRTELVLFEDVEGRLNYHVKLLAKRRPVMAPFLKEYGYAMATKLLERFSSW